MFSKNCLPGNSGMTYWLCLLNIRIQTTCTYSYVHIWPKRAINHPPLINLSSAMKCRSNRSPQKRMPSSDTALLYRVSSMLVLFSLTTLFKKMRTWHQWHMIPISAAHWSCQIHQQFIWRRSHVIIISFSG